MKIHVLAAALGAAIALPNPAFAADTQQRSGAGHYEWRTVPQFGPRATGPMQKRVWVSDHAQTASCGCAMMKTSADDCMRAMHRSGARPSVG